MIANDVSAVVLAAGLSRRMGQFKLLLPWDGRTVIGQVVATLRAGGVQLLIYRPDVAPWQFRSHRLRRLHRKLCQVDGCVAFVGGINVIDDMNTPGHKPPRVDFAVSVEGPVLADIVQSMQRVWALAELVQFKSSEVHLFPHPAPVPRAGTQTVKFAIRDNLRHRRDIERAYLAGIRTARREILIANAYFFPGLRFRHALMRAAERGVRVILLLQGRVEYALLHYASRALYGSLLESGVEIHEYHRSFLHAKVAVIDGHWATVGSSNIDPFSLMLAREANVVVEDRAFAAELRASLQQALEGGARYIVKDMWLHQPLARRLTIWLAYGVTRFLMGMVGYGGQH